MNNKLICNSKIVFMQTAIVAFFIDVPALNQIVISFFPGLTGIIMTLFYSFTAMAVILLPIVSTVLDKKIIEIKLILLIGGIVFGYLLTCIFAPYSDLTFVNLGIYTVLPILVVLLFNIDGKLLITFIMALTTVGILNVEAIFTTNKYQYETISMGLSYAFMPTVVAAIVYSLTYFKDEEKIKKIMMLPVLVINFVYFFKIIQFGSRGVVLCFACCFAFFFCFKHDNVNKKVSFKGYKAFFIFIIIAVISRNMWTIFWNIEKIFESVGLHINAINKFFRLSSASGSDISNGRNLIFKQTFEGVWQSPILGHGYSTTMNNLGFVYPHNFVLQLLYDGGLLLTIPVLYLFVRGIISWYNSCDVNEFVVIVSLILMSVPGALFTGNLWENNRLWLTFAALTIYSNRTWIYSDKTYEHKNMLKRGETNEDIVYRGRFIANRC